ncbi:hypothetical protein Tco_0716507 [Tanacetum coccineum]
MASFDYRLNPLYAIKECSSCGALYTRNCGCSKGSLEDKILVPVPDSSQRPLIFEKNCLNCGDPVHGLYCRQCALIRKTLEEVFQDFQDTSESSDDDTNFVNENQEPFVVNQDPGKNSSQSPPHIDHCCYGCGDSLDGIFCQRCTCESCGKGAHIGYNCPPKVPVISKPEPCNNQTVNELPQTLPSVHPTSCSGDENSFTYDSKPNFVDDSPNVFNPPPQPSTYSYEICGNDAYYVTLVLLTEEPVDSVIMEDEHLDTILATKSDKVIKSSVEKLVPIPSESEGIPDKVLQSLCDNPTPLEATKDHSEIVVDSNDDSSLSDDDSFSSEDIEYVDASPPDAEIVSLEVVEIIVSEVGGIDTDILLTIKDDILHEKLLNVNLFIAKIEALKDNLILSSEFVTKSPSTSLNLFLEETNTFDNSLPETKNFRFNLEGISSGSPITCSDSSLPDYEAFYLDDDHIEEKSSGSTTTHSDISLSEYDSFIFDFYHEEFADELAHIISSSDLECFYFKSKPDLGDLTSIDPGIRENVYTTNVNVSIEDDQYPLFVFVVWIFLAFLTYPVVPPYLLSIENEDTIFDSGISIYHSFMLDVSHRSGTFMKFNVRLGLVVVIIVRDDDEKPCINNNDSIHGALDLGSTSLGNMISMKNEGTAQVHEGTAQVNEGTAQVNEGTAQVNESTAHLSQILTFLLGRIRVNFDPIEHVEL